MLLFHFSIFFRTVRRARHVPPGRKTGKSLVTIFIDKTDELISIKRADMTAGGASPTRISDDGRATRPFCCLHTNYTLHCAAVNHRRIIYFSQATAFRGRRKSRQAAEKKDLSKSHAQK